MAEYREKYSKWLTGKEFKKIIEQIYCNDMRNINLLPEEYSLAKNSFREIADKKHKMLTTLVEDYLSLFKSIAIGASFTKKSIEDKLKENKS